MKTGFSFDIRPAVTTEQEKRAELSRMRQQSIRKYWDRLNQAIRQDFCACTDRQLKAAQEEIDFLRKEIHRLEQIEEVESSNDH